MKKIFTLLLFILLIFQTNYGQILTFEFSELAGNEAFASSNSNDPNLGNSTITRGSGLAASANGGRFNATSWALTSIENAVSGNDYMEFTITPNSGYQFTVSSIVVQWQRSNSGNTAIALRSSVDGYASDLDGIKNVVDNTSTQTFTWTFSQANSTTPVTYRFYSYAEATSGSGGPGDGTGNDIVVNGTVTPTSASNDTDSEVDGPALSSQPNPTLVSSLADSDPEAVRVFDFDVWDLGTSDGFPTKITSVTVKPGANNDANWANTIAGAKLSIDAGTTFVTTGTPVITASSIVFPIISGNLDIADADAETISLYIYLKNSGLIDNSTLEFIVASSLHGFTADASGSQFAASIPGATSNEMLIDVVSTELRYVQQPTNTEVNVAMNPAVKVQATDANGNLDLDFTSSISITSTGTLTGSPVVVAAVSGLATFSTLTHTALGTGLTLNAERDGTGDWDASSDAFDITEQLASICYEEHFDANVPAGWVNNGTANETNGLHSGIAPNCRQLGSNTDITSPSLNNPQILQFYQDASTGGNGETATIQYQIGDSGSWTELYSFSVNTSGETETVDLTNVNGVDLSSKNYVKFKFISSFNTWYLDDVVVRGSCVLPIEIVKLDLIKKDNNSVLFFSTSSEINNSHFLIEWSRDAKNWNEIGTVKGSGTTHDTREYSYIHENPKAGINYYRLTQVDFDGRKETFPAKSVYFESNQRNFDIIPNLAFNNVKIEFEKPVENGRLHIYNIEGQLMQTYVLASGIDILRIDVSELPAGQYIAKYIDGEDTINKKFVKQ